MKHFNPICTNLIHFIPSWSIAIHSDKFLLHLNSSWPILTNVKPYWSMWIHGPHAATQPSQDQTAQLLRYPRNCQEKLEVEKKTLTLPRKHCSCQERLKKHIFATKTWNQTLEIENLTFGKSNIGDNNSKFGNRKLWNRNLEIGKLKSEIDIKFWIRKIENEFLKTKFGNRKLENRNRTSLGATRHSSSFGAHHSVVALILESLLRSRSWALRYSPLKRENVRIPSHRMSVVGPEAYDTLHWN